MPLLKRLSSEGGKEVLYLFWCPGCRRSHPYTVETERDRPRWQFNGDESCPTFTPSLRVLDGKGGTECHLFVTAGQIQFCGDCPHPLAGQTVPMVDLNSVADYA